jgi:glycosyltransferase involved in cell wall biosynthesis
MKILHVSKKYPKAIGGDANVVYNLQSHQRNAGHDVTVLTTNCREIIRDRNIIKSGISDDSENYDRITFKRLISLLLFFCESFHVLSEQKPEIIHSHSPEMGFLISIPARLYHIPVIHTCHGICFNNRNFSFLKRKMELFFLKYGGFQFITTVDKNSLPDFRAKDIRNIVYIPNGVDISLFSSADRPVANSVMNYLFVGRLERQKGLDVLIDAVIRLKKVNTNFTLTIIGDGSLKEDLIRCISDHSLESTIHMMGAVNQDELIRKYSESDALILPSRWEGLPLTLLEAWAAGLPVIVSNVGGLTPLCEDMVNAIVIDPVDPQALCRAMRFLMNNRDLAQRLGSEGNQIVKTRYAWNSVNKMYENIYRQSILYETA